MAFKIFLCHLLKLQIHFSGILPRLRSIRMQIRAKRYDKSILLTILPVRIAWENMMTLNRRRAGKLAMFHIIREYAP